MESRNGERKEGSNFKSLISATNRGAPEVSIGSSYDGFSLDTYLVVSLSPVMIALPIASVHTYVFS